MAKLEPMGIIMIPRMIDPLTIGFDKKTVVFCVNCKHRDPEDKKCDHGDVHFNVARDDWFYCANGEVSGDD